ncbi:BtrH N-terminal domain-containing protein [Clostridium rectalis]|uniref:BtrH N-terminal domain-containing protein n=1 Tax=Clostridium rectalis TaxID=2040295 RepID=UPI000F63DB25|nr:BtrH N-terminal domain-containing protein [Clostridium rectalis]
MKILNLPHRVVDYLCPVNGLCDIYQWKTGKRIPEELIHYSSTGFMLMSEKNMNPPKRIFLSSCGIGKAQYDIWKDLMGYTVIADEGKEFKGTIEKVKELIDKDIPVIIFGLDMYYLEYLEKFYHKIHIPGHVILMVGYDENYIYVYDNSRMGTNKVSYENLKLAWEKGYIGISKKNAYFGINFTNINWDRKNILNTAFENNASGYLNSNVSFMGLGGFEKFIKEFETWNTVFNKETLRKIYIHLITYTGSILPGLPKELDENNGEIGNNPHRASRDRFAKALLENCDELGDENWKVASKLYEKSGIIIEKIIKGLTEDIILNSYNNINKYIKLFTKLKSVEERAQRCFLK